MTSFLFFLVVKFVQLFQISLLNDLLKFPIFFKRQPECYNLIVLDTFQQSLFYSLDTYHKVDSTYSSGFFNSEINFLFMRFIRLIIQLVFFIIFHDFYFCFFFLYTLCLILLLFLLFFSLFLLSFVVFLVLWLDHGFLPTDIFKFINLFLCIVPTFVIPHFVAFEFLESINPMLMSFLPKSHMFGFLFNAESLPSGRLRNFV